MKEKRISLRQTNKGFTLVELCVTMVIFSIIATISTMGLLKWQQYSSNNEMENKAELIYMALRNSIAKLKANNVLDETEGWGDVSTQDSNGKYYMVCNAGDYIDYKEGNLSGSKASAKLLFDLTVDYLHDKKMLNYDIVVSYSIDGVIYGVYYSDRSSLSYKDSTGKINVLTSDSDTLYENVVGAYINQ